MSKENRNQVLAFVTRTAVGIGLTVKEYRRKILAFVTRTAVGIGLILGAGAVVYALVSTRPVPVAVDEVRIAPKVLVIPARQVPVQRQWRAFGTARVMDSADVPARVTATVIDLPQTIVAGAEVEQGQLLVRLDASDFQRQVEITQSAISDISAQLEQLDVEEESWLERVALAAEEVELAQADFDRVKRAYEDGAAKEREVDQERSALVAAIRLQVSAAEEQEKIIPRRMRLEALKAQQDATLKLATQNVERCEIISPISGVLQFVDVEIGENLQIGQRVARVVNLERVEVPVRLPSSARPHVGIGDAVDLTSGSGASQQRWSAVVARIGPGDDESTRTFAVYAEVVQEAGETDVLTPGRFVKAVVTASRVQPRVIVPRRAISAGRVQLVRDGLVVSTSIAIDFPLQGGFPELGVPDLQWAVLRDPLPPDDLVVVTATRSLVDGASATPVLAADVPETTATNGRHSE